MSGRGGGGGGDGGGDPTPTPATPTPPVSKQQKKRLLMLQHSGSKENYISPSPSSFLPPTHPPPPSHLKSPHTCISFFSCASHDALKTWGGSGMGVRWGSWKEVGGGASSTGSCRQEFALPSLPVPPSGRFPVFYLRDQTPGEKQI